ncbi:MAG: metallophosphoesterase family protein [Candidatus Krumholzibacteriota bacterium]|nr:metallophosphoesterase family protein [Candidatus Krumholzibacteriota bacterium]
MKVFVCSDVHGNWRALEAVLEIYRKVYPCSFLFLGDCIGYGAHPDACLDRILALPRANLLIGNHEWALLDNDSRQEMNDLAARTLAWSEKMMHGKYDDALLSRFTMRVKTSAYIAAHASPYGAERWPYIYSAGMAEDIFDNLDFALCFIGHTHLPVVYTNRRGRGPIVPGEAFALDKGERYIVNPGSVGQSRDGDPRASCCLFDGDKGTITFFRCEYDVEAEAEDIRKAGLPPYFADRLIEGS